MNFPEPPSVTRRTMAMATAPEFRRRQWPPTINNEESVVNNDSNALLNSLWFGRLTSDIFSHWIDTPQIEHLIDIQLHFIFIIYYLLSTNILIYIIMSYRHNYYIYIYLFVCIRYTFYISYLLFIYIYIFFTLSYCIIMIIFICIY